MIEAPKSVLIVDDNDSNREILARRLESLNLNISVATNGRQALEMIYTSQFDLVLLDIMMPEINGYEVLQHLKSSEITNHLPIIVTSGIDDVKSIARCINLGAEDYLIKPINNTLLNARISTALEKKQLRDQENHYRRQIEDYNSQLESRVREQVREISASQMAIIYAMAKMAEFRDMETGKHIERVRDYCNIITHDLVASGKYRDALTPIYMENIINASPLHDIGKVGVYDSILLKPGKLTPEEFEIMKTHPIIGRNILRAVNLEFPGNSFISVGIEIAECHHEKWDGSGYPKGLKELEIPLSGRIVALADVYDALISKRVYKEASSHEDTVEIIKAGKGKHFDPVIVDSFIAKEQDFKRIASTESDEGMYGD